MLRLEENEGSTHSRKSISGCEILWTVADVYSIWISAAHMEGNLQTTVWACTKREHLNPWYFVFVWEIALQIMIGCEISAVRWYGILVSYVPNECPTNQHLMCDDLSKTAKIAIVRLTSETAMHLATTVLVDYVILFLLWPANDSGQSLPRSSFISQTATQPFLKLTTKGLESEWAAAHEWMMVAHEGHTKTAKADNYSNSNHRISLHSLCHRWCRRCGRFTDAEYCHRPRYDNIAVGAHRYIMHRMFIASPRLTNTFACVRIPPTHSPVMGSGYD